MKKSSIFLLPLLTAFFNVQMLKSNLQAENNLENKLSESGLSESAEIETPIKQENTVWQDYLSGKKKKPGKYQKEGATHPYLCTAFVQTVYSNAVGEKFCK